MPPSTSPRPYRSTLRDEQARATQRRIVAAGHDLFVEQGYAPTTIDAIAAHAGVSRKTVFTSVGGKAAVLKLAWDWALAGDDEPVPMADRPDVQAHASRAGSPPVDRTVDAPERDDPVPPGAAVRRAHRGRRWRS